MPQSETIVVVGAGVIGLTAALRIQQNLANHQSIVIVAREFPNTTSINYASPWAGAHYRPTPGRTAQVIQQAIWAQKTYDILQRIAAEEPAAGVNFMVGEEYFERPSQEYLDAFSDLSNSAYGHLSDSFEQLNQSEIGDPDVSVGIRYWSWCLNPPVYTAYLLRKFVARGGRTRQYTLAALEEAFSLESNASMVINCSGMGFGDPNSFIIRGQTCLVRNPCSKTITRQNADGSWSFVIPRPLEGGTIIGGTKQPNDWNPEPSLETRKVLLSNAAKYFSFQPGEPQEFQVIKDIVGRRPARNGGLNLKEEVIQVVGADGVKKSQSVIHAYGAGGAGFELSWGVADNIVKLLIAKGSFKPKAML